MESYIQISQLNDFVFCPRSLYWHGLYSAYSEDSYKDLPQKKGTQAHENIDEKKYSTSKKWLMGMEIFSEEFGICGKIDLYNEETGELIERKRTVKKIYDGYRLQVWAQAICLEEMGYKVNKIFIHSLTDNTRYEIENLTEEIKQNLKNHIETMHRFSFDADFEPNPTKCAHCIYAQLCDHNPLL